MTPDRWNQIENLFGAALQLAAEKRAAFIDSACVGDEELRREVQSLIRSHEQAETFIESPALEVAAHLYSRIRQGLSAGQRIDRYRITGMLGAGGMGEVYRAVDTQLEREVAIKILPPDLAANPEALARFKREAKAVAGLSHPNILALHDFGYDQDLHFAVIELLEGETLADRLLRGPLQWRQAVEIAIGVADGLTAAHAKGTTHRDLKPSNIFMTAAGQTKILDFGLATIRSVPASQSFSSGAAQMPLTRSGLVMGTPAYMSPEQVRGEEADARSDIFSFGCVLYEMVTGRRAFARPTAPETMTAILNDDPPRLADAGQEVPSVLEQLIGRCLAKQAEKRYPSGSELALDLRAALDATRRAKGIPSRSGAGFRRTVWVGALITLLLVAAAGLWWQRPSIPEVWPVQPLSLLPGNEDSPDLSPDGNFVAFSWSGSEKEGPGDIYIKAVGSEGLRQLTHTPFHEYFPAWSPDGTQIAFVRAREGIFVVPPLGSPERKVSDSGDYVRWTPDGLSLLIRDSVDSGPPGIFQISLATLERRLVVRSRHRGVIRFNVSPDGKNLAFTENFRPDVSDAYVVSMNGGEPQRRTNFNALAGVVLWTPGGRDLILNTGYGYPLSLWRVPAFGAQPERGAPIAVSSNANLPTISHPAPGRPARLAFVTLQADISLRLIDLTAPRPGGVIQAVQPLLDTTLVDYPGSFSHDATKIAFNSTRVGDPPPGPRFPGFVTDQLWVAGRDGSGLRQLTKLDSSAVVHPAWSPDDRWIAFEAAAASGTNIQIIRADGGESRRLTTEPSTDAFPSWSADGSTIYFNSDRTGRPEIWKIPAVGGAAVQVTRNGGVEPIESMDGKSIYYLQPRLPQPQLPPTNLKRVPVSGGDEMVVLRGLAVGHWAVTEKGIFFMTPDGPVDALDLYNPSDGKVTRFGRLPFQVSRIGIIGRITVSRDGRWALTLQTERWAKDISMVDNFR